MNYFKKCFFIILLSMLILCSIFVVINISMKNIMTEKIENQKTEVVKIVNIVLYPKEQQTPENYLNYFEQIYKSKKKFATYGERKTGIKSYFPSSNNTHIIHGDFFNGAFFEAENHALDTETNEIIPYKMDPKKGLAPKIWRYYFFADYHRLVFFSKEASEPQILKFLNKAFASLLNEDDFRINIEKDENKIEEIITSAGLTKLHVSLSYSNNDNYDDWAELIDSDMRDSDSRRGTFDFTGTRKKPIQLMKSKIQKALLTLSRSNGHAEAVGHYENGISYKINTQQFPQEKAISYIDDPTAAIEGVLKSITNNEGQDKK